MNFSKIYKNKYPLLVILFLIFAVRVNSFIKTNSATYDEHFYIGYGYSLLETGEFRFRKDKTNLVPILSALPLQFLNLNFSIQNEDWIKGDTRKIKNIERWVFSEEMDHASMFNYRFLYENSTSADKILTYARMPILLISLLLAFVVYKWASDLFGYAAGIFALLLYTFSPNILAHSGLATEDLVLSCFMFLFSYLYWKFLQTEKLKFLILSASAWV